ncbi:MAG: ABC transporter permease, partial [Pseudomonadota bacterium]
GEAAEAARRNGIDVRRMKFLGMVFSGLTAGLTAVLLVANLSSAAPQMAGDFLLNGIAAALLGMTMFTPGKPNIAGSFCGALIIAVLANGLVLLGAPYYLQDIMLGVIIIGSVAFSASVLKKAAFSL